MTSPHPSSRPSGRAPAPLVVAASLAGVEAVLLVIQGAVEVASFRPQAAAMAVTTSVFFLVYGVGLALCAWAVLRLRSWARAPIVVAQLIQLLVGWNFWGGSTTWVAVALILVAVIVLAGIFHPASLDALADEPV